jgi:predicted Ser/Thr protein kinase
LISVSQTETKKTQTQTQTEQSQNETSIQSEILVSTQSRLKRSQITFNELVVEKEIGEGSYGRVYAGKWNGAPVALKFCRNRTQLDEFMHEVRLMM